MSSQGPNATSVAGYAFNSATIRDTGDWIKYTKERRVFKTAKAYQTEDPWIPYANSYRLTFLNGKFKCGSCNGNAFGGLNTLS